MHVEPLQDEPLIHYHWVDTESALEDACFQLAGHLRLAVDTEFVRTHTYYPRPGLIQVSNEDAIFLIDPSAFDTKVLQPLGERLMHPDTQLLMHSAGEDLEIFLRLWGRLPENLFDTQVAAGFCGFERQMGLQRLLKDALNIELSKGETRSDWLQRPLTDRQCHYAAADVRYLFELADLLVSELERQGRLEWCEEDCRKLVSRYQHKTPDDQLYLGFGGGWKMSPAQQAALKHLACWRETLAKTEDTPKTFIAKDASLYALVEKRPTRKNQLNALGFQGSQIRKYGEALLEQLDIGLKQPVPAILISRPLTKRQQARYKELREWVRQCAEGARLPADLLASKAQLCEYLVVREEGRGDDSPFVGSWRHRVLEPFLNARSFSE